MLTIFPAESIKTGRAEKPAQQVSVGLSTIPFGNSLGGLSSWPVLMATLVTFRVNAE